MRQIILIAHDIRSAHNVGSLLRTADGLGVHTVYLTGYTPYPMSSNDRRLPHVARKLTEQIAKTALGAEKTMNIIQSDDVNDAITNIQNQGYTLVALEQHPRATLLSQYTSPKMVALLIGREVQGIDDTLLERCKAILEIPMLGQKESLNVAQATAIALYSLQYS